MDNNCSDTGTRGGGVPPPADGQDGRRDAAPTGKNGSAEIVNKLPVRHHKTVGTLWHWINIGFSIGDASVRYVNYARSEDGWQGVVDRAIIPFGATHVSLHNPFGISSDRQMRFDQVLEALVYDFLSDEPIWEDFVSAWTGWLDADEDRVLMLYIGKPGDDTTEATLGQVEAACLFHPRIQLGIDAAATAYPGGVCYEWIRKLERSGRVVWIEAWPAVDDPRGDRSHWNGQPTLATWWFLGRFVEGNDAERTTPGPLGVIFEGHRESDIGDWARKLNDGDDVFVTAHASKVHETEWKLLQAIESEDSESIRRAYQALIDFRSVALEG